MSLYPRDHILFFRYVNFQSDIFLSVTIKYDELCFADARTEAKDPDISNTSQITREENDNVKFESQVFWGVSWRLVYG